jgi:hypothetical protein
MINYENDLICNKVFPPLTVERDADLFYKFDNAHLRLDDDERSASATANQVDYDFTTDTFNATRKALRHFIDDDIYNNADEVIKRNYRRSAAQSVLDRIMLKKEKRAADIAFNAANFSGKTATLSGTDQWSDDNSNPFEEIADRVQTVLQNSGKKANSIIMGYQVWTQLRNHPDFIDRLPDDRLRAASIAKFKELLSDRDVIIDNILIGSAQYNSATEGAADAFSFIWGKDCLVAYIDGSGNTVMDNTLSKTFIPRDLSGLSVEYYRQDERKGLWVEVNTKYVHKIVNNNCGYLLKSVVA